MGSVTARSISSGAIPGSCVTICTCTSCTSGNASIGRLSSARRPKATSAQVSTSTNTRWEREKVMSLSSTPRAASGAGGQFRVEQQGPPDHHALVAHEPRTDVAEFAVLHHELDLPLLEHAGLALDEHERIQALGHQR